MAKFFYYARNFALVTLLASVVLCCVSLYQLMQTMNRYLTGAGSYTCREFTYDMTAPDTDRFGAMLIASIAYGVGEEGQGDSAVRQRDLQTHGVSAATNKIYKLCEGHANTRIFSLLSAESTGKPVAAPATTISGTAPVGTSATIAGTTDASPTNTK